MFPEKQEYSLCKTGKPAQSDPVSWQAVFQIDYFQFPRITPVKTFPKNLSVGGSQSVMDGQGKVLTADGFHEEFGNTEL